MNTITANTQEASSNKRPIVCGTDFSALATEATDVAAAMARRLGTKLVLVHVEEYSGMAQVEIQY